MNDNFDDAKRDYLSLIQEPIGRLSTASSVFKGFAATIVTGVATLSPSDIKLPFLCISFIPLLVFAALDIYYLQLEKRFRGLYEDVRVGKHDVDFLLELPKDTESIERAGASLRHCLCSPSFLMFYPSMIVILVVVCFIKRYGGI